MHTWLDFWFIFFWLTVSIFIINYSTFVFYFLYSELVWLTLYCLTLLCAIYIDDINLLGFTFFFLAFAALEFSIGFLLLILMKIFKVNLNLIDNNSKKNFFIKNKYSINFLDNYFWLK